MDSPFNMEKNSTLAHLLETQKVPPIVQEHHEQPLQNLLTLTVKIHVATPALQIRHAEMNWQINPKIQHFEMKWQMNPKVRHFELSHMELLICIFVIR